MRTFPASRTAVALTSFVLIACGDAPARSPIVPDRNMVAEHKMTPDQMRQMTGVDRLPEVLDKAAMKANVDRSYPAELRSEGVSGTALIDVAVDATGTVESVKAVSRPAGITAVMIIQEKDGTERRVTPKDHPAFQRAAVAAFRNIRFSPAVRDGQPVPYTLRMTVMFDPPARRQ